ncbi:hypothetical protein HDU98_009596 [Podochytrium sp. JEL0797]|nr:hypothetical protein HDU98_009596 [Podochytrium sp. JEL0797]
MTVNGHSASSIDSSKSSIVISGTGVTTKALANGPGGSFSVTDPVPACVPTSTYNCLNGASTITIPKPSVAIAGATAVVEVKVLNGDGSVFSCMTNSALQVN